MATTTEEIAQAFSSHRFVETYSHLAPNIAWNLVGESVLHGRSAVIAACEESSSYLSQMNTDFHTFRSVVGRDAVVIDSLAEYVDADGQSSFVASCDIYDFVNGAVATITSYTVEVDKD